MNIIKKTESSELKKKMLPSLKEVIEKFTLFGDTAVFLIGNIDANQKQDPGYRNFVIKRLKAAMSN